MKKIIILALFTFIYAQANDFLLKASLALKAGLYNDALKHISDSKKQENTNSEIYKIEGLIHEALDVLEQILKPAPKKYFPIIDCPML